ncbi:hypothetical protein CANMA_000827 [Candida margitis]|uniref:uncharacterized protein n=1 Tax=Candida margitis TaxID=1775924 RepID=UPI002225D2FD|nr:uncharacterized protein CANMA_000827 [Candida margitis]KAI5970215.1 hypothetical protein CANMA_000827 [Candida margitis]
MKLATSISASLLTLTPMILAASADAGSLKMDFNIRRGASREDLSPVDDVDPRFVKRSDEDGAVELELINNHTLYLAELYVGSNEEKVQVQIDTGSSDLWFMSSDVQCEKSNSSKKKRDEPSKSENVDANKRDDDDEGDILSYISSHPEITDLPAPGDDGISVSSNSAEGPNTCTVYGSFSTDDSDTFVQNGTELLFVAYADGTSASGTWGHDTVKVANISVSDVSFGIVNDTNIQVGILGLGLPGLESLSVNGSTYENLPLKMKSDGAIKKALYSLYLNGADAKTGSILFGAIDHAKYEGTLETLPVLESEGDIEGQPSYFIVALNSISFNHEGTVKNLSDNSTGVLLDSGSTLSYVQPEAAKAFAEELDGEYSESAGAYVIDCKYKESNSTLDIKFVNKTIHIPLPELVLKSDGKCYLGILEDTNTGTLFGDNILRSAYIVYDVEDTEVHIGQAYYTDDEDIEVVDGKVNTAGGQNSTVIDGGSASNSNGTNSSGSSNSTSSGTSSTSSSKTSSSGTSSTSSSKSSSSANSNDGLSIFNLSWVSMLAGLMVSFSLL